MITTTDPLTGKVSSCISNILNATIITSAFVGRGDFWPEGKNVYCLYKRKYFCTFYTDFDAFLEMSREDRSVLLKHFKAITQRKYYSYKRKQQSDGNHTQDADID